MEILLKNAIKGTKIMRKAIFSWNEIYAILITEQKSSGGK